MTPLAAAAACLMLVTLCYAVLCAVSPFTTCRKCSGFGATAPGRLRRRPQACRRCHGSGLRLRLGRRLHNHSLRATEGARRLRDDARH
ncbi:hypothetical protein ACFVXG_07720 [Kitasatospora sp. NPDC058162]|uniref:hypothetical protein n=1 Tax=Kitasatospora sp. NPDC058162 TaxID=3346362 RepID=UPI0036D9FF97